MALLLCAWCTWLWRASVLEEAEEVHLVFEVGLGAGSDGVEKFWTGVTDVVFATVFIVDDERDYLITEAPLHHDQLSVFVVN